MVLEADPRGFTFPFKYDSGAENDSGSSQATTSQSTIGALRHSSHQQIDQTISNHLWSYLTCLRPFFEENVGWAVWLDLYLALLCRHDMFVLISWVMYDSSILFLPAFLGSLSSRDTIGTCPRLTGAEVHHVHPTTIWATEQYRTPTFLAQICLTISGRYWKPLVLHRPIVTNTMKTVTVKENCQKTGILP